MVHELRRFHLWPWEDEAGSWNLKYWIGLDRAYMEVYCRHYEEGKEAFDLVGNVFDALAKLAGLTEAPTEPVEKVGASFPLVSSKEKESRLVLRGPERGTKNGVWNLSYEKLGHWPFKPSEYPTLKAAMNDFYAVAGVFDKIARLAGLTGRLGTLGGWKGSWGKSGVSGVSGVTHK